MNELHIIILLLIGFIIYVLTNNTNIFSVGAQDSSSSDSGSSDSGSHSSWAQNPILPIIDESNCQDYQNRYTDKCIQLYNKMCYNKKSNCKAGNVCLNIKSNKCDMQAVSKDNETPVRLWHKVFNKLPGQCVEQNDYLCEDHRVDVPAMCAAGAGALAILLLLSRGDRSPDEEDYIGRYGGQYGPRP